MKNQKQNFLEFIKKQGLKDTPQRRTIVDVFFSSPKHLNIEDLYGRVKDADSSIGQATVYRTLKLLCEAGLAKEMHFDGDSARYEPVSETHHDHLICTMCSKTIEVVDPVIEKNQEALATQHGFILTSHRMYLYGICPDCRKT